MKNYGVNELREMYLKFFESKDHLRMKSFSLIPHNDKSLLLINAGMAPLKPYFTGQEIPPRNRVTTCQKCIRTGDIENVGKTARHGTFFEMLGNFSFGDYFKHEAIAWTWEFLTEVVGLDANRLYPSIFEDDDEAFEIWNKEINIAPERIFRFGKADNFWEHGAGPCGPCSEVYYDRGEAYGCGAPECTVGCDCDRYMEVWNNVFTQFDNDGKGNYTTLEKKNIDTGMGLERLAVVVQDVDSIFDVDTIKALRERVCEMAGVTYKTDDKKDISIRLITDHIRSVTFMASDGIMPSNEGRGYVLRRLLRRAARHGRLLGIKGCFLAELSKTVIRDSSDAYPELVDKQEHIFSCLNTEEENFNKTIDQGLSILTDYMDELKTSGNKTLTGDKAFKLYDTYGFPLDLTKEILEDSDYDVDQNGFDACMQEQRMKARKARKESNYMGADATVYEQLQADMKTEFLGYVQDECDSQIIALTNDKDVIDIISEGEQGALFVAETTFYAEKGGQVGDKGIIYSDMGKFVVKDTIRVVGGKMAHIGYVESGELKVGDTVHMEFNKDERFLIRNNHTATHLLHKALKVILGPQVEQAGSLVAHDRLRFDFSYNQPMTREQILATEKLVNDCIEQDFVVRTDIMKTEEAKKTGAIALFGEKYEEMVRVVNINDWSVELCGGTHVANTAKIGTFKILSEQGIAAGVRRIEAQTCRGARKYYLELENEVLEASAAAKSTPDKISEKIEHMLNEIKALQSENQKLKARLAKEEAGDALSATIDVEGVKVLPVKLKGVDMNALRNLGDEFKSKLGTSVIVLASEADGKVNLIAMATDDAVKKGAHAGNIIKLIAPMVGGGGGGRPNMAQAGGKNAAGIDQALDAALEEVKKQIV